MSSLPGQNIPVASLVVPGGVPGPPGASGSPGPPLNIKGTKANSAALPGSGNTVGDVWITLDTNHAWVWLGSAWQDLGPFQGPAGSPGAAGQGYRWLGAWSSSTAYVPYDSVNNAGTSYVCIVGHTNQPPPSSTYWNVLALAGSQGPAGPQGPPGTSGAGGDMTRAVYDTDGNNRVDSCDALPYSRLTSVPLSFTPSAHATVAAGGTHLDNGSDPLPVATTSRTGSAPKLSGDATTYLDGSGHFSTPAGTGGSTALPPIARIIPPAPTYYVSMSGGGSTTGADANNPVSLATFNSNSSLAAGSCVKFLGTFTFGTPVKPQTNGASGNPTYLDFRTAILNDTVYLLGRSYLTLVGGTHDPSFQAGSGILVFSTTYNFGCISLGQNTSSPCHDILIDSWTFIGANSNNYVDVINLPYGYNITITNCKAFNCGDFASGDSTGSTFGHDIVIAANDVTTSFNTTDQTDIISIGDAYNVTIERNRLIHRTPAAASIRHNDVIQTYKKGGGNAGNPYNWVIRYNYIESQQSLMDSTGDCSWFIMQDFAAGPGGEAASKIYANVFVGTGNTSSNGIQVFRQAASSTHYLYNNTFIIYDSPAFCMRYFSSGSSPNVGTLTLNSHNNVGRRTNQRGTDIDNSGTPAVTANHDYNYWFNFFSGSATTAGPHGNYSQDPEFIDYFNGNFSPAPGSPLLGAGDNSIGSEYAYGILPGSTWPNPTIVPRGQWDIGAYVGVGILPGASSAGAIYSYTDHFLEGADATYSNVAGSGGGAGCAKGQGTSTADHPGTYTLTSGTAGGATNYGFQTTGVSYVRGTSGTVAFRAVYLTPSVKPTNVAANAAAIHLGLGTYPTSGIYIPVDGIFFVFDPTSGQTNAANNWYLKVIKAGTITYFDLNVAFATSTWITMAWYWDANGVRMRFRNFGETYLYTGSGSMLSSNTPAVTTPLSLVRYLHNGGSGTTSYADTLDLWEVSYKGSTVLSTFRGADLINNF